MDNNPRILCLNHENLALKHGKQCLMLFKTIDCKINIKAQFTHNIFAHNIEIKRYSNKKDKIDIFNPIFFLSCVNWKYLLLDNYANWNLVLNFFFKCHYITCIWKKKYLFIKMSFFIHLIRSLSRSADCFVRKVGKMIWNNPPQRMGLFKIHIFYRFLFE